MNGYEEKLASLNEFRYNLIHKKNSFWNKETEKYDYDPTQDDQKIDELAKEIETYIKSYFHELSFDFIMEQLANLGQCPNLLNDDNGHWAITCDGYQNVVFGDEPEDVETSFFVEAKQWRNTPREALIQYLNEE